MIGFWKSRITEDFLMHSSGLSEEQLKFLQTLKKGDRLIIYCNDVKEGSNKPKLVLKIYKKE